MAKINGTEAKKTVQKWLDHKRVKEAKREQYKAVIEVLEEAVKNGELVLNEDNFHFTLKLTWPIENSDGEITLKELDFMPRLNIKRIQEKMTGIKGDSHEHRILANIAASTRQPIGVIQGLDVEDYGTASAVGVFFLY